MSNKKKKIEYGKTTGIRLHDSSWFGVFVPVNPVVRFEAGAHLVAHVWVHLADIDVGSVFFKKKNEKRIKINFHSTGVKTDAGFPQVHRVEGGSSPSSRSDPVRRVY